MSLTSLGVVWTRCLGQVVDLLVGSLAVSRLTGLTYLDQTGRRSEVSLTPCSVSNTVICLLPCTVSLKL